MSLRAVPQLRFASIRWNALTRQSLLSASILGVGMLSLTTLPSSAATPSKTAAANKPSPLGSEPMAFLQNHCLDCHDGKDGEGGFGIQSLSQDLTSAKNLDRWVDVFDRVSAGDMPPPDEAIIEQAELHEFIESVQSSLRQASQWQQAAAGRVQGRRLSNTQLERTLQDLLRIRVPVARLLPAEPRTHGFVHLAESQTMSHYQLQGHLRVVDAALEAAFDQAMRPRDDFSIDYPPEKIANKRKGRRNREPEMREGLAIVWSASLVFYGRISSTTVKEDGWYDIEVTASAIKPPPSGRVWCSVRSGECVSSAPLMSWIGAFEATKEPQTMRYRAWIPAGHRLEIRPADVTLKKGRFQGGQVGFGEGEKQGLPGVAMHRLKMKRVYPGGSPKEVREALLGKVSLQWNRNDRKSYPDFSDLSRDEVVKRLQEQIVSFASRAFRRPVAAPELKLYFEFVEDVFATDPDQARAYVNALQAGYRAILCSPRFLYLNEPNTEPPPTTDKAAIKAQLDDWAIAQRLSYFLCGSLPDEPLRQAAAQGQLRTKQGLLKQTERLLHTERGQNFWKDFAGQWLDLVDIDFTLPDRRLFADFDPVVQNAMLAETHLFLQKLFDENRPVCELVDTDFTFLNSRLADYYGIRDEIEPEKLAVGEMQLVSLKPDSPRGGLLSQGAILKVTANGNDTSPVLRGIWVSERILGKTIPPPPANVPAVEPDIRGAKTIRELLAKHQSDPACAACHKNFDPPGFALENFDAGGKWRDRYRQLVKGRYKRTGTVDASYAMPDGREFESFSDFCELIADRDHVLAANIASQLLAYATGAKIEFADRAAIQQIVANTKASKHGMRDLLNEVVLSPIFLNK